MAWRKNRRPGVPAIRTAQPQEKHYSRCGALPGLGNDSPHICKETTPGTVVLPTRMIPIRRI